MSYLLNEKLTSTVVMYMVLKRIIKPWKDWDAYKHGIIDVHGKRLRKPRNAKEREGWDILDRFCWSIKRLCTKYLGDSNFAYLFSAVYLMKEQASILFNGNKEKYICELEDLTPNKQLLLYRCITEIDNMNLVNESNLDKETSILKIMLNAKSIINEWLAEDEGGAAIGGSTALGDIAQVTQKLRGTEGNHNRRLKMNINKRKLRRKHHGNNRTE